MGHTGVVAFHGDNNIDLTYDAPPGEPMVSRLVLMSFLIYYLCTCNTVEQNLHKTRKTLYTYTILKSRLLVFMSALLPKRYSFLDVL